MNKTPHLINQKELINNNIQFIKKNTLAYKYEVFVILDDLLKSETFLSGRINCLSS